MVKGWESGFVVKEHKLFHPRCGSRVKIWKQIHFAVNVAWVAPNDNPPPLYCACSTNFHVFTHIRCKHFLVIVLPPPMNHCTVSKVLVSLVAASRSFKEGARLLQALGDAGGAGFDC